MDVISKDICINFLEKIESGLPNNLLLDDDDVHTSSDEDEDEDEVFELPSKSDLVNKNKGKSMR